MQYSPSYSHLDVDALTREGIAALKTGQQELARSLLIRATEVDPRHEQAWLWLSGAVTQDTDRLHCLQQVLKINPNNESAHRGLALLLHPEQPPASLPPAVTTDDSARVSSPQPPHASYIPPQPAQMAIDFVLDEFGEYKDRDTVIRALAEFLDYSWADAERVVAYVEVERRSSILARQAPVLLVGAAILLVGSVLAFRAGVVLWHDARAFVMPEPRAIIVFAANLAVITGTGIKWWKRILALKKIPF